MINSLLTIIILRFLSSAAARFLFRRKHQLTITSAATEGIPIATPNPMARGRLAEAVGVEEFIRVGC
jgi:hypothetical protein